MSRYRRCWPAATVLVAAIIGVLATAPRAVPPSAPVLAALVAAATVGLAETATFAVVGVTIAVFLARYSSGLRGEELVYRGIFVSAIGVLAVVLAIVAWRQKRQVHEHGTQQVRHRFGMSLLAARSEQEVARAAAEHAGALGASVARCAVQIEGGEFQYLSEVGMPPAPLDQPHGFTGTDHDVVAVAVRLGTPRYWSSREDLSSDADGPVSDIAALGIESLAVVPLVGTHETIGAYVLGFRTAQPFDDMQRADIELWAAQLTVALERARLADFERSVAEELQRSLLGPPKLVKGVGTVSRYLPAVSALAVGGDWHDTMQLPGGRVGIAVGDVVGQGLSAASVMGQLRAALDACAIRSTNAAEAVESLHAFSLSLPGSESTTVAFAIVDPANNRVDYCCAGHPPPLCIDADGHARFLDQAQSWPLGLEFDGARPHARTSLPPGSLLLMYSDGLVERRTETLDAGFERLQAAAVERYLLPLDQLCDELIAVLLEGSERRDDVVLLALRTPVSSPQIFLRKESATPDALAPLRDRLRDWLQLAGVSDEYATDLLIATGEACMNAVQHAYHGAKNGLFRVEGSRIGGEITVTVTDTGTWKEEVQEGSTGRRGIRLMQQLAHSVNIVRRDGGTSVTLRFAIKDISDRAPVPA